MILKFSICLMLMLVTPVKNDCLASAWYEDAKKLSGTTHAEQMRAMESLKKKPKIEEALKQSLRNKTKNSSYALDVICALKWRSLWKEIIDFAETDESGIGYLALLSLSNEKDEPQLKNIFLKQLTKTQTTPVTKMILLDALHRLDQKVPVSVVDSLLNGTSTPEEKSATLYYLRGMLAHRDDQEYRQVLEKFQNNGKASDQLRTQLGFMLNEIKLSQKSTPLKMNSQFDSNKKTITIAVAFGYKDTRPSRLVGDRYERAILIRKLEKIGFKRSEFDDDRLMFETKTKQIIVNVFNASTGPDDEENRKDPYQNLKSEEAMNRFLAAISDHDLVFYTGHSRNGGGPDFSPPILLKNLHVDYPLYQRTHQNKDALISAWKKSPKKPSLLGLYSCFSELHFSKELQKTRSKENVILTVKGLIYYAEALEQIFDHIAKKII